MKVEVLKDFVSKINDNSYKQGQILDAVKLDGFGLDYAIYNNRSLDWIPKNIIKII